MSSRSKKNADIEVDRGTGSQSAAPRRVREMATYLNPSGRMGGSASYREPPIPSSHPSSAQPPPELMEGIESTQGESDESHDIPMPASHEVQIDEVHESSTVRLISTNLPSFIAHPLYCQSRITEWLPHRAQYLDEFLRHDGRGSARNCVRCGESEGGYRCEDCHHTPLFCHHCLLEEHRRLPLHRVQVSSILCHPTTL
jgi:hypothetical protein